MSFSVLRIVHALYRVTVYYNIHVIHTHLSLSLSLSSAKNGLLCAVQVAGALIAHRQQLLHGALGHTDQQEPSLSHATQPETANLDCKPVR